MRLRVRRATRSDGDKGINGGAPCLLFGLNGRSTNATGKVVILRLAAARHYVASSSSFSGRELKSSPLTEFIPRMQVDDLTTPMH